MGYEIYFDQWHCVGKWCTHLGMEEFTNWVKTLGDEFDALHDLAWTGECQVMGGHTLPELVQELENALRANPPSKDVLLSVQELLDIIRNRKRFSDIYLSSSTGTDLTGITCPMDAYRELRYQRRDCENEYGPKRAARMLAEERESYAKEEGFDPYAWADQTDLKMHRENMADIFGSYLEESTLPLALRRRCSKAAAKVFHRLNRQALDRFDDNVSHVRFLANAKDVIELLHTTGSKGSATICVHQDFGAAYGNYRQMYLAGRSSSFSNTHVYAHMFMHAIDGPNREISRDRAWKRAWQSEISEHGLSELAATSSTEGLAEFGRLLYSGRLTRLDLIKTRFPKSSAVFEQYQLW